MLWVIYVRQQLITGAIQLSDTAAAAMLGWRTQKVKRWRPALLQAGLIREVQPVRGTQAAIYVADEADSPPNLDSFDPAKTRTLERFDVNGQTVTVYARCGELAAIEARLEVADDDDQRALLQLAQTTRLLRARDVLDGPLEGAGRDPDYHAFLTTGCDGATDQRWPGTVSGDVPT